MRALELFSCSGGMAEGFRRAGLVFDLAVDFDPDARDSYEANLGHRPIGVDVRDLLRLARAGWSPGTLDLLVADPPCTPWSRAGKRLGVEDERDMLTETCELVRLLRPRAYLIGNVPGLQDCDHWPHVQEHIGGLARLGYCAADYAQLDSADYGVPQRRVRPWWFGHLAGPCIRWPERTHGSPEECAHPTLPGMPQLRPWVTCREALSHLPLEELGRPVRLKIRKPGEAGGPNGGDRSVCSTLDAPASVIVAHQTAKGGQILISARHPAASPDLPAPTIEAKQRSQGTVLAAPHPRHPLSRLDKPSFAIKTNGGRASQAGSMLALRPSQGARPGSPDLPGATLTAKASRVGGGEAHVFEWPWDRPATTVWRDERLTPPGHRGASCLSGEGTNAIVLSEKAAAILQGFPDGRCRCERESWVSADRNRNAQTAATSQKTDISEGGIQPPKPSCSNTDASGETPTAKSRKATRSITRTKTSRTTDLKTSPLSEAAITPESTEDTGSLMVERSSGAHPAANSRRSTPIGTSTSSNTSAAINSASTIGDAIGGARCGRCGESRHPWRFCGKTKKSRWSQLGQAMPPPLAEAVARSVLQQLKTTDAATPEGS